MSSKIRLAWKLASLGFRVQLQFKGSFLLNRIAQVIAYGSSFGAIFILTYRIGGMAGWVWRELLFLMSFQLLSYSLGAAFCFVQFRELESNVRKGTFDLLLVKPAPAWLYIIFAKFNFDYIGHVCLALTLMAWSSIHLVDWNFITVLYLFAAILNSAALTASMLLMIGALSLFGIRVYYLYVIFFSVLEFTRYPIVIFPLLLQVTVVVLVPLAFMSYIPVAYLLDHPIPIVGPMGGVFVIFVGPLSICAATFVWHRGLVNYQGAGG
ncbi:ABC transporter permease [Roseibium marinum]|uniref:ABC-2 type transport system permease protein n=1 Tax=Roseibium marinum TaxID=281252 RepID=A0A2S3UJB1_9HYPH|nr:ABC-2 family transporter protein [Roseibium marinum]POF27794.1 ABC-2 type transport system permease protein [Roseibium marinum]